MNEIKNKKSGFTLAETLITLTVLGIIAAIIIPGIIRNYQKHVIINQLKNTYSTVQEAINQSWAENPNWVSEYIQTYNEPSSNSRSSKLHNLYKENIVNRLNINFECYNTGDAGCHDSKGHRIILYKNIYGDRALPRGYNYGITELKNGARINYVPAGDNGLFISIDANGVKKPNIYGRDLFWFYVDSKGNLLPYGHTRTRSQLLQDCKETTTWYTGQSLHHHTCAGIVIKDGFKFSKDYPWW